jgi:hypothetical protein
MLAYFGNFFEKYVWVTLFHGKRLSKMLKNMGWATFCTIFFTNSSGRPARD